MIAIAHFLAVSLYIAAALLAAAPFARPVGPPVRPVVAALSLGVLVHFFALAALARSLGELPLTGLGPALSFAGLALAVTLLVVELLAREVSLTLVAAPFAALPTAIANLIGLTPALHPRGAAGAWLVSHIALSFVGIAAFATAAAAGAMYLVEHRELKSRRFGAIFRAFPPLDTLDRVNHVAAVAGWIVLTLGAALALTYAAAHHEFDAAKIAWALSAWAGVGTVAVGRVLGGWQAKRAALVTSVSFLLVVGFYVAVRISAPRAGAFL